MFFTNVLSLIYFLRFCISFLDNLNLFLSVQPLETSSLQTSFLVFKQDLDLFIGAFISSFDGLNLFFPILVNYFLVEETPYPLFFLKTVALRPIFLLAAAILLAVDFFFVFVTAMNLTPQIKKVLTFYDFTRTFYI